MLFEAKMGVVKMKQILFYESLEKIINYKNIEHAS